MPEANQLLKYIPEAVPTLNSYANMCRNDVQEYCFLLFRFKKTKTTYKYETHYRAKKRYIYVPVLVTDQYYMHM